MKDQSGCEKTPNNKLGRWSKARLGGHGMVRRLGRTGEKVFGLCAAKTGTKVDESMQAGDIGHERTRNDV